MKRWREMKPASFSVGWEFIQTPQWLDEFSEVSVGETEKDEPTKDQQAGNWTERVKKRKKKRRDDYRWNYSKRFRAFQTVAIENITVITWITGSFSSNSFFRNLWQTVLFRRLTAISKIDGNFYNHIFKEKPLTLLRGYMLLRWTHQPVSTTQPFFSAFLLKKTGNKWPGGTTKRVLVIAPWDRKTKLLLWKLLFCHIQCIWKIQSVIPAKDEMTATFHNICNSPTTRMQERQKIQK